MISVIVPGYNVADTVAECLRALEEQTVPRHRYEVIFVDDGSMDGTAEVVRAFPGVRLLQLPENRGRAAARNLGLHAAKGDIVLYVDADCVPARDWIEAMLRPFADAEVVGAKGVYRTRQRSLVARFVQVEYEGRYKLMRRQRYIDFVDTYSAGYRREALLRAGGFDPALRNDEDQELSFRLAEAGHKMAFNPEAVVYHRHPATLGRYLRRKFDVGYWKAFVLRRHPAKALRDSHTPQSLKVQMALAFLACCSAIASVWCRSALVVLAASLLCFLLSALPFLRDALRAGVAVGLASLPLLFLRALALGAGLGAGSVALLCRRREREHARSPAPDVLSEAVAEEAQRVERARG